MDYGYGHSFSIFPSFSSPELAGRESTSQKKRKEDLATAILGVGGGSGFGDIYQFVIYLRRFFFFLVFFIIFV